MPINGPEALREAYPGATDEGCRKALELLLFLHARPLEMSLESRSAEWNSRCRELGNSESIIPLDLVRGW